MANICEIAFSMQVAAACAAVLAAIIWWRASRARKPSDDIQTQLKAASGDVVHVLDRLMQDVATQSRLNGHADSIDWFICFGGSILTNSPYVLIIVGLQYHAPNFDELVASFHLYRRYPKGTRQSVPNKRRPPI